MAVMNFETYPMKSLLSELIKSYVTKFLCYVQSISNKEASLGLKVPTKQYSYDAEVEVTDAEITDAEVTDAEILD